MGDHFDRAVVIEIDGAKCASSSGRPLAGRRPQLCEPVAHGAARVAARPIGSGMKRAAAAASNAIVAHRRLFSAAARHATHFEQPIHHLLNRTLEHVALFARGAGRLLVRGRCGILSHLRLRFARDVLAPRGPSLPQETFGDGAEATRSFLKAFAVIAGGKR